MWRLEWGMRETEETSWDLLMRTEDEAARTRTVRVETKETCTARSVICLGKERNA